MQADPPVQPPQPPGIDIGGLASAIGQAFQTVLSDWAAKLPRLFVDGLRRDLEAVWDGVWASGANVFGTPRELTIGFAPGIQLETMNETLVYPIILIAIVLLALRNILRTITGRGGTLDEAVNGVLIGALLGGASWMLMSTAYTLVGLASDAFGRMSYAPNLESEVGPSLALSIVTLVIMFVYSFRLWIRAAYRIVLLMFLTPFAPIAGVLWAIPQTKWITVLYFTTVGGWLVGGFLALGALSLGIQLATIGNTNGVLALIFGVALVQIAYDLMSLLSRGFPGSINTSGGGGIGPFGGGVIGAGLAATGAAVASGAASAAAGAAAGTAGNALAVASGTELAGYGY